MTELSALTLRRATAVDLPAIYVVFYENEVRGEPNPPPPGNVPLFLKHELATGEMWVAERGGRVVGFAALLARGAIAYLAELFVHPDQQSTGVGRALLNRILPKDGRVCCTLSSRDPRAVALYTRAGMRPQWTNLWLRADTSEMRRLDHGDLLVVQAEPGDPELARWDATASGRYRPADHAYWTGQGGIPLWFERGGRRTGYGYVRPRSGSLWSPDTTTVGPAGAVSPGDARDCVCAAAEFARTRAVMVRLAIPGPHPALIALLDAGLRIVDVETFHSSAPAPFIDPERYTGSGDQF
ncbi:MAG: GNAT family N-acetyltransferase [Chloroflexi bacterium]|nr:GNAT family N-acetyltransferase [Chloroflexota bacterium]